MKKLRKLREVAAEQAIRQAPPHPFLAGVSDDEPFWRDLPDILQSQILVMIDNGMPTKKNPKPRPVERILWAWVLTIPITLTLGYLFFRACVLVGWAK